jgi:transposase
MLSLIGKTIITLEEREGSCCGLRARHEVSSFPPGENRGLTWCSTPNRYKADVAWHSNPTEQGGLNMTSFYLGIDVSKGYADFVIINKRKQTVMENFQLDDTFQGHSQLYEILERFLAGHQNATLYAAVESTGGFENNWHQALISFQASLPIQTARLNPKGVMHNSKADLKRNKTDKISARSVAEYLVSHPEKVRYQQEDSLAGLRKQWGFIQMLTKQCTQYLNQLQSLMYTANPELLSFCRDGIPGWVVKLLLQYPTSKRLAKARAKTLAKIPYVTLERAQKLIAAAKNSVASSVDDVSAQLIIATATQILHLKKTIAAQTNLMAAQCDVPEIRLLKTFVGIGDTLAIGLMIEVENIARFKSAKKLSSFWGVHPIYKISGDGSGSFKMSKEGRIQPRRLLYLVALTAIKHNPVIKPLYEYHLQQGRERMDAIGICMHKILRIIYGMLKNNTAFDPKIDEGNRKRELRVKRPGLKKDKNRRFQNYDAGAPVSRRQNKKRMEREQSQSVNNTECGISAPVPMASILADVLAKL